MSLNLDKNKDVIVSAYREVMDHKNPIDWALFSYDGQTYDLNLVSKGDGGLEELADDFNSGKIMYALVKVKVEEKNTEKVVLINWQGEGAPLSRKGTCANHLSTVKNFFKGVHLTLNARTDEDIDPIFIQKMVRNATSGDLHRQSSMSSDIESDGRIDPVGTYYKRLNPMEEINSSEKDAFWRKQEEEDERRRKDEQNRYKKFSQNEVKQLRRESQDYFNHEEIETAASAVAAAAKSPTPPVNTNGYSSSAASSPYSSMSMSSAEAVKASTPMRNSVGQQNDSSSNIVKNRIKSFNVNGAPPPTPKSVFSPTSSNNSSNNFSPVNRNIRIFQNNNSSNNSNNTTPTSNNNIKSPITTNGYSPTQKITTPEYNNSEKQNQIINSNSSNNFNNEVKSSEMSEQEQESRLSVLKRKQLFESGNFNSGSTNTYSRRNPAEEIKIAQMKEKENLTKKTVTVEKESISLTPITNGNANVKVTSPTSPKVDKIEAISSPRQEECQETWNNTNTNNIIKANTNNIINNNNSSNASNTITTKNTNANANTNLRQAVPDIIPNSFEMPKPSVQHHEASNYYEQQEQPKPKEIYKEKVEEVKQQQQQPIEHENKYNNNREQNGFHHHHNKIENNVEEKEEEEPQKQEDEGMFEDTSVQSGQRNYKEEEETLSHYNKSNSIDFIEKEGGKITAKFEITADMGLVGRALYDYQASDDTEITFDPGDIITNIDQVDEGWWEGMSNGEYGLFPSNYIELLN